MTADITGIRVVLVNNFPGPGLGGGEVLALTLARGLVAAGAEVRAVVVPGSGFGAELADCGMTVVEAPMRISTAPAAIRAIADQAAGDGDGRVVVVGTGYWTNLLARRGVRGTGARLVNFTGVIPGASIADGGSQVGLALRRLVDRATLESVDAFVVVASAAASALIAEGAPRERVHAIPNSIDADALRAAAISEPAPGLPPGRPLVVCAGRLETVKGVEYLIRAAVELPDVTFAITGSGPLDSSLRKLAASLGVAQRVSFLGRVPHTAPVLSAADIVALPSLSEGLPTVALEAMALSRPVVATCVGGTPEAVEDGVTGLLVAPADPPALAAAIRRLAADPQLAHALGEAGAKRVEERFSSAAMIASWAELIAKLAVGG